MNFLHQGSGTGTLNGIPFPVSSFTIFGVADSANRQSYFSGWLTLHSSASISITGVGTYQILTPTHTFVNNDNALVGFSRSSGSLEDLFNGPTDAVLSTWDMLSPLGPIVGTGVLLQWDSFPPIDTSGGILFFESGATSVTFTAITEPTTLSLLVLGAAVVLRYLK